MAELVRISMPKFFAHVLGEKGLGTTLEGMSSSPFLRDALGEKGLEDASSHHCLAPLLGSLLRDAPAEKGLW